MVTTVTTIYDKQLQILLSILNLPVDSFFVVDHLQVALLTLAVKNGGVIVVVIDPHLKREQPILLEHHLLAYVEQV